MSENTDAFDGLRLRLALNTVRLRKAKGMTADKLAVLAGLNPNTLFRIENPMMGNVSLRTLVQIAKALDVTVQELLS